MNGWWVAWLAPPFIRFEEEMASKKVDQALFLSGILFAPGRILHTNANAINKLII
jgi:hypothetical protein